MVSLNHQTSFFFSAMFLERDRNPKCQECGSLDIDQTFRKVLRCLVCNKCKNEHTEKYSLLTKTECKEVSSYYIKIEFLPFLTLKKKHFYRIIC